MKNKILQAIKNNAFCSKCVNNNCVFDVSVDGRTFEVRPASLFGGYFSYHGAVAVDLHSDEEIKLDIKDSFSWNKEQGKWVF